MKYKCDECKDTGFVGDQHAGRAGYNSEYSYCDCELGKSKNPALYNKTKMNWKDELKKKLLQENTLIMIRDVIPYVESLLKKQRESCSNFLGENTEGLKAIRYNILNAPEPGEE